MLGLPDTMIRGAEHGFSATKRYGSRLLLVVLYHTGLLPPFESGGGNADNGRMALSSDRR